MLFIARDGMKAQLLDLESQVTVRSYAVGELRQNSSAYSPVSQAVMAHQSKNCTLFLSPRTQQPMQRCFTPELVTCCATTRCGTFMLAGTASGTLLLWNLISGQLIKSLKGHLREVTCASFSADDSLAATTSQDSVCKVWQLSSLLSLRSRDVVPRSTFTGHSLSVNCCKFLHYTNFILTGSNDKSCRLVDAISGQQLQSILVGDAVTSLAVAKDDGRFVAGTVGGFLYFSPLYCENGGQLPMADGSESSREAVLRPPSPDGHHSPLVFLHLSPTQPSAVLSVSEGGAALWYDMGDGRLLRECFPRQKGRVLSCCVVPRAPAEKALPCSPLDRNPVDPMAMQYSVSKREWTVPQRLQEKRQRTGETDALIDELKEAREKNDELLELRAKLMDHVRRLTKTE